MVKKEAGDKHRTTKLMMERSQLRKVNSDLRNQMFSDMALGFKARGIERKGKDMY